MITFSADAQLVINEIMPCNVSFVMDEYTNYSMWVEIYNKGLQVEDLEDYHFTDNLTEPVKWHPQRRLIQPGGFARIWFERDDLAGHSNFKLEPNGGSLYLMKDGVEVDGVHYPVMCRNASWGRKTDGGEEFSYFIEPSTVMDKPIDNPVEAIYEGDKWNYHYQTYPPSDGWNLKDFDDSDWNRNRQAPLGYGKPVNTVIGSPNNPPAQTAYFRKKINITGVNNLYVCRINSTIDDAAAFFVNGTEVYRYNLPAGELEYSLAAITARVECSGVSFFFPASLLTEGENLIAVEVHQSHNLSSSDIYFDLSLTHNNPANILAVNEYSNNGKKTALSVNDAPLFTVAPGFYDSQVGVSFYAPGEGITIRYTTDGTEPSETSTAYTGDAINLTRTTCIRAVNFSENRMKSRITTGTFFIGERDFTLPVVSITTDPANLFDSETGIYTVGSHIPANYWWDWDRPAHFELFDASGTRRLNQELDISCGGMYSRERPLKSLKISPRKKFGDNRLRYDIFDSKRGKKYKDIQLRNAGNDFERAMLRDAFMQTIIIDRLDVDYLAYQPAICFLNGIYYGVENLRERSSKDYLYTNYDLDEGEFLLIDRYAAERNEEYLAFRDQIATTGTDNLYNYAKAHLDIDSYIDYFMSEIYYANTDWIINNIKLWKHTENGRWRFILYDTDYGFGLVSNYDHNTISWVFDHEDELIAMPIQRLVNTVEFKKKFLNRFAVHLSTTFEATRVKHILDSLANKISGEMSYHKQLYGNEYPFKTEIGVMKTFAENRADHVLKYLGSRFASSATVRKIYLSSNNSNASFIFNDENVPDKNPVTIKYFRNNQVKIIADDIDGNSFRHWELAGTQQSTIISDSDPWMYWDGNSRPENWNNNLCNSTNWKTGNSPLGYGAFKDIKINTVIGFGDDPSKKNATAYFRKTFTIANKNLADIVINTTFDDGLAIYVNGYEVGRANMDDTDLIPHNILASGYGPATASFNVPENLLVNGENTVAVEVHQHGLSSSDLLFTLNMLATDNANNVQIITDREYAATLNDDIKLKAIYETGNKIGEITTGKQKTIRTVRYYDLLGREKTGNDKGIIIKQVIYTDGSSETEKIYQR
ncbi:MAG: CotH kinase family protein [Dysgonamonadaceae bacterium]|jgi:hypothetical protein|nr:CotH kinase family protein [Dysgonamonadaceae bacterium]